MGLSAPRKLVCSGVVPQSCPADFYRRVKLSHDPNNTTWSRNTTKYGQKILESQGWTPGEFLGATNVPYAAYHTAANASHIRIVLKDDTLGLGARPGRSQEAGPTTGLDMFQNILGRLNGKSESQLATEENSRSLVKRSMFVEQRWGSLRFVSGGFLVGDDLLKPSNEDSFGTKNTPTDLPEDLSQKKSKRHHKKVLDISNREKSKSKPSEKEVDHGIFTEKNAITTQLEAPREQSHEQKPELKTSPSDADENLDKARRKAEKAKRKLKRKAKIEAENVTPRAAQPSPELVNPQSLDNRGEPKDIPVASDNNPVTRTSALHGFGGGRQAVRHRYIQQKKMAMTNSKTLNEVCSASVVESPSGTC